MSCSPLALFPRCWSRSVPVGTTMRHSVLNNSHPLCTLHVIVSHVYSCRLRGILRQCRRRRHWEPTKTSHVSQTPLLLLSFSYDAPYYLSWILTQQFAAPRDAGHGRPRTQAWHPSQLARVPQNGCYCRAAALILSYDSQLQPPGARWGRLIKGEKRR